MSPICAPTRRPVPTAAAPGREQISASRNSAPDLESHHDLSIGGTCSVSPGTGWHAVCRALCLSRHRPPLEDAAKPGAVTAASGAAWGRQMEISPHSPKHHPSSYLTRTSHHFKHLSEDRDGDREVVPTHTAAVRPQ